MRVSIIIDNYNYGHFLSDAIESALAQTYPDVEVVVVDDGSTDGSRDVIARFGPHIVSVFQENGGQGAAFNAGFEVADGDVIVFLDADDWLDPTVVSEAIPLFDAPGVVKVGWPLRIVDGEGSPTGALFPDGELRAGDLRDLAIEIGPLYDTHHDPPTSGNAWSRGFLEHVMPAPADEFRFGADVYLHTVAPIFGELRSLSQPGGAYRVHGRNNYWAHSFTEDRIERYVRRFETSCLVLERFLADQDVEARVDSWLRKNWNHVWMARLRSAREIVENRVPEGGHYILVDDQDLGGGFELGDRVVRPFLERQGEYWGPPPDDPTAISELERMRAEGVTFIAFWFTCFWWFDAYPGFAAHLHETATSVAQGEDLRLWRLAPS